MSNLNGKVAIVTGGTSGIGEATAKLFAGYGAKVVVAGRREDRGISVVKTIEDEGGEAIFIKTDVTHPDEVASLVEATIKHFGRLDCAVNNAGATGPTLTPLADIEESEWDDLIDINLKSVWMCMKYEIPAMLKSGGGSIVNISSIYGFKPSDVGHAPYATSKHAVIGLSKSAAVDYGQDGIRVNAVSPGFTHSEMVDPYIEEEPELMETITSRYSAQNRIGEAKEVAEAVAWLCSDASSFVNGAVLVTDGGDTAKLY